jgi:tetratricopeptide (TPR) repeat protein
MRAREGLAEVLWVLGDRPAAIAHLWALLELNPNDNQGVRDILANWLLTVDDAAGVDRLLDRYPDEASAQWAFTKALQLFRCEGGGSEAEAALREALEVNPFVVLYLLGAKQLPRQLPPYVGLGDENEAVSYVAAAGELWLTTPGALEWLVSVMQGVIATNKRPTLVHRRHARRGSSGPTGREGTE